MTKINLVLGVSHNFQEHSKKFINEFNTFELKGTNYKIPKSKDYIYHSGKSITLHNISEEIKKEKKMYDKFPKLRRFSFDIGPCFREIITVNNKYYPAKNTVKLSQKKIFNLIEDQIVKIKKNLPKNCELAIENLNYYNTPAYKGVCLPKFYNEISRKFSLFQVLDIAHLEITAINTKKKFQDLIKEVDHSFVKEIHISKIRAKRNKLNPEDAHLPPDSRVFKNLKLALSLNPNKKIDVVIEHWKYPKNLQSSYKMLKQNL